MSLPIVRQAAQTTSQALLELQSLGSGPLHTLVASSNTALPPVQTILTTIAGDLALLSNAVHGVSFPVTDAADPMSFVVSLSSILKSTISSVTRTVAVRRRANLYLEGCFHC